MTIKEAAAIERLDGKVDALTGALHDYHVEVAKLAEACKPCKADVAKVNLDMYGIPGDKDAKPGLMGEGSDLKRSRTFLRRALQLAWAVLLVVLGAYLKAARAAGS